MNHKKASVIDKAKTSLDPQLWMISGDKSILPKLKPEVLEEIKSRFIDTAVGINGVRDDIYALSPEVWSRFYLIGSSATYQWTPTCDIDITIVVDPIEYRLTEANNNPIETLRMVWKKLNGQLLSGTQHPVNYWITTESDIESDAIYDMNLSIWVVAPQEVAGDYNPQEFWKDVWKQAEDTASRWDVQAGSIRRNLVDLKSINEDMATLDDGALKKMEIKTLAKKSQIMSEVLALLDEYRGIHDLRRTVFSFPDNMTEEQLCESAKSWVPANVMYKVLERYGYTQILSEINNIKHQRGIKDETLNDIGDMLGWKLKNAQGVSPALFEAAHASLNTGNLLFAYDPSIGILFTGAYARHEDWSKDNPKVGQCVIVGEISEDDLSLRYFRANKQPSSAKEYWNGLQKMMGALKICGVTLPENQEQIINTNATIYNKNIDLMQSFYSYNDRFGMEISPKTRKDYRGYCKKLVRGAKPKTKKEYTKYTRELTAARDGENVCLFVYDPNSGLEISKEYAYHDDWMKKEDYYNKVRGEINDQNILDYFVVSTSVINTYNLNPDNYRKFLSGLIAALQNAGITVNNPDDIIKNSYTYYSEDEGSKSIIDLYQQKESSDAYFDPNVHTASDKLNFTTLFTMFHDGPIQPQLVDEVYYKLRNEGDALWNDEQMAGRIGHMYDEWKALYDASSSTDRFNAIVDLVVAIASDKFLSDRVLNISDDVTRYQWGRMLKKD